VNAAGSVVTQFMLGRCVDRVAASATGIVRHGNRDASASSCGANPRRRRRRRRDRIRLDAL